MVDDAVKLIGAAAGLINSFAWPLVAVWLIWKFAPVVRAYLGTVAIIGYLPCPVM
jgi:hypothetical protein